MEEQQDPVSILLSEFGTRLNELEEKQRLIKERILLIGENLVSTKEEYEKREIELRKQLIEMTYDLKSVKQVNKRIIEELENFARREEFAILERQIRIFQPLEYARVQDIKNIVQKEMSSHKK